MTRNALPPFPARPAARRTLAALSLALALAVAGAVAFQASAEPPQTPQEKGTKAEKGSAESGRAWTGMRQRARQRARERLAAGRLTPDERLAEIVENAWWNDADLAGQVHLTESQRHQMDGILRDNLTGRRDTLETSRDAQKAFYEALEAGDLVAAGKKLDAVDAAHAAILHAQLALRIDIAEKLTPGQRKALETARPRLWRERWIHLDARPAAQPGTPAAATKKSTNKDGK